ncbi:hypothetical protein AAZX31_08G136800 [Glycine max]|uniref:protein SOSEKI 2 isoform X1 n=1 Tax=Glycine max TaxID=3847 RepID=UPI0002338737|nr:protein SOSEKI 2 isoform X1 [Glycine max]KAH1051128.1 hypothetical protein GYH30_021182 [Glycine max]KRH43226.2 hypothetical protein GLYMA_08G138500v4 [Glycine max]|eukprot:XP_003532837.1 protein UPSTREAM OF FLC isoform X1 [Glycine max]
MDVVRSQRGSSRDTSPDRAKICRMNQKVKPFRKVQVVYYLSRNGLLEHPHFMELTLLPNQPLRLKDVFDRLMALRGTGMPLQYSWSSKRNYKSGYVWYDLGLKDIIHPAEGGEYVLKGSELVEGCSEAERFNVRNKQQGIHQQAEANYNYSYDSRSKALGVCNKQQQQRESEELEEYEEQEKEYEEGEKTSYTSSTTTPHSGCSRGVSTEEVVYEEEESKKKKKGGGGAGGNNKKHLSGEKEKVKRRVVDGDGSGSSRYSGLLQLIACGGGAGEYMKGKQGPRLSDVGTKERDKKALFWEEAETEMSENPRLLGNLQTEEKEYFSGSLVDSIKAHREGEPVLNKSNSYNELRRSRLGMVTEEDKKKVVKGGMKDKCIPLIKSPKTSRK